MRIDVTQDTTLIALLIQAFPQSNRTHIKKAIRYGCVTIRGAIIKSPEYLLKKGQYVEYRKYQERETVKSRPPFRILFEDQDVMVVFKPAGILSSGRTTEKIRSMFGMVNKYVKLKTRERQRAYTVHRLDREVSGLLMFAKSEEARNFLQDHWKEVEKYYYALVEGVPERKSGTVESWLKENARQMVYSTEREEADAKWSVTHYSTEACFSREGRPAKPAEACFSLLRVRLETGRKNQIRVHLSEMGCPIVGDRKYGAEAKVKRIVRLFAYSLSFPHPVLNRRVHVEIPLPESFVFVGSENEY